MKRHLLAGLAAVAMTASGSTQGAPSGLTIQKDVAVGAKRCDVVTWTDANGRERSVAFVRAGGDTNGHSGGYVQRYTYFIDAAQKTGLAWDAAQEFVSGLGCAVNHHSGASSSKANSTGATTGFVFEGANHCLWRFHSTYSGDGRTVGLTIDWFVGQGRNDILWAVSYDATGQPSFNWDARGPYFQFDWDGCGKFYDAAISGIRWGDKYAFRTTAYSGATSSWDYTQQSAAPHMLLYKDAALGDVEAGVVQTQTWAQQDAGGYWWASAHWGQTGTGMMENWNCPFQLNAYEGYAGEKMAWGSNFGFVGNPSYQRIDYATNSVGAPHQGYSTWIVLNKHSAGLTDAMIGTVAAVQQTALTATTGTVTATGPRHANLAGDAAYQPAGWNHVYGAWALGADASNAAAFNMNVAAGTLVRPLFSIGNYTASTPPATVTFKGATLAAGTDYAASVDTAADRLWLTLFRDVSGTSNAVTLSGPAGAPPPAPPPPDAAADDGGDDDGRCGCGTASFTPSGLGAAAALLAVLAAFLPRRRS